MRTTKQLLYAEVSRVREHCAGDSVAEKPQLLKELKNVLEFAMRVDADLNIIAKLSYAEDLVMNEKTFGDRLAADKVLCEILNVDLKGEG